MQPLNYIVPDGQVLVALQPEELAGVLLAAFKIEAGADRARLFHPSQIAGIYQGRDHPGGMEPYPEHLKKDIEVAIGEAWYWLKIHMLLIPDTNDWCRLSRRAWKLTDEGDFKAFRHAIAFPKELLHPSIADKVWLAFARNDLDDAVFTAFKRVEIAVRTAAGLTNKDIGVPLMRKAFKTDGGPLTDMSQEEGEREALAALFSGAIGSYKNPHSHRTVTIAETREAQEMVLLASHLLRIVDSRSKA